jgi:cytochrome c oxidase subunit 1
MMGMPRRYPDYPDFLYFLNLISSLGSWVRVVGVITLILILYERLVKKNFVMWVNYKPNNLEWMEGQPPKAHSYKSLPFIVN